jgi:hypothetical protein
MHAKKTGEMEQPLRDISSALAVYLGLETQEMNLT